MTAGWLMSANVSGMGERRKTREPRHPRQSGMMARPTPSLKKQCVHGQDYEKALVERTFTGQQIMPDIVPVPLRGEKYFLTRDRIDRILDV